MNTETYRDILIKETEGEKGSSPESAIIAYFTMEIAVAEDVPTYSGGLGMLAGDAIRSAADLKVPAVAVSLLYRKGYFFQRLDAAQGQTEEPINWSIEDRLVELEPRANVAVDGRQVAVRAWQYVVRGAGGFEVPVLFLDTDIAENSDFDRTLSHVLYGGDSYYRLCARSLSWALAAYACCVRSATTASSVST